MFINGKASISYIIKSTYANLSKNHNCFLSPIAFRIIFIYRSVNLNYVKIIKVQAFKIGIIRVRIFFFISLVQILVL